jgi:peptidoglycan/LPS O-acetylase OafA/YrhL
VTRHEQFRALTRFGSLDGLRALAIAAVIWHHGPGEASTIPLLRQGFYGVNLFFAISGFLITSLLLRERDSTGSISLFNFYVRRTLRIFPIYYTVIALYVILVWATRLDEPAGWEFLSNLPYFLTYTSNWFVTDDGIGPAPIFVLAWSLATEEQFYLTWPWVQRYARQPWPSIVMALICLLIVAVSAGWLDGILSRSAFSTTVLRSLSLAICLGVLLAHVLHSPHGFDLAAKLAGRRWTSLVVGAVILLALSLQVPPYVANFLMVVFVCSCVVREDHLIAGPLKMRWVVQIGVVSYGMYLLHPLVYNGLTLIEPVFGVIPGRREPLGFVTTMLLTTAAATISYRYYEFRFLRLKDKFCRSTVLPATIVSGGVSGISCVESVNR